jgi:hypothetical protein
VGKYSLASYLILLLILILSLFFNLFAQENDSALIVTGRLDSTSQNELNFGFKNRNQFFNNQMGILNSAQRAKLWGLENQKSIWSEVYLDENKEKEFSIGKINWYHPTPTGTQFGLDYRESSLFIPINVREYNEFKMGRSRYVPLPILPAAAYLANVIYSKYGYLLQRKEQAKYDNLTISDLQLNMMRILWNEPGISETDWYTLFTKGDQFNEITFVLFHQQIEFLINKYLIKTRRLEDDQINYFPAIKCNELIIRLKNHLDSKDYINSSEECDRILTLIKRLEDIY